METKLYDIDNIDFVLLINSHYGRPCQCDVEVQDR